MWISKIAQALIETHRAAAFERSVVAAKYEGEARRLEIENARLRSDLDWFKLRLNQVEQERAMLMADRIGVRINVPQFMVQAEGDEGKALHELPDMSTVGGDAKDQGELPVPTSADPGEGVDFSIMPGYRGDKR